ncbi:transposase [Streptomyces sp. LN499]|uniref:transposase n=1 Tax=Streptomyces sp. LN499 TaxID=3112977 RepID=UPI00371BD534
MPSGICRRRSARRPPPRIAASRYGPRPACDVGCTGRCWTNSGPGRGGLALGDRRRGLRSRQKGGSLTGPNPVDRGKKGSKPHVLSDAQGIPLAIAVSGANIHDSLALKPLIRGIPAVSSRAPSAMAGRRRGCGSRPPAPVDHFHKL